MADTLADLMREVGLDPPAYLDAAYRPRPYARAQPRVMRSPTERANDPTLAPSERRRAYNQAQAALTPPPDAELGGATGVSPNQVADAGRQLWELTPVPPAQRLRQAIDQGNPSEAVQSAGTLALNTAGLFGFMPRGARAPVRPQMSTRYPTNDLDQWVLGGSDPGQPAPQVPSRAEILPSLIELQRSMDSPNPLFEAAGQTQPRGATMGEVLAATTPEGAANLRNTTARYLRGVPEDSPLLGTSDIAADPMATLRPRGLGALRPPQALAMPNEDRYLFGRPAPSDATRGGPPRPPDSKSYRSRKPPSGGFLLPRRKT